MVRSVGTVTGLVTLPLLSDESGSKVVFDATVAVFVTLGAADAPTATVSVMAGRIVPLVTGPERVQVTVPLAFVQVQPVPVAETYVSPAGRVSVTVIVPAADCGPLFLAVSV